MISMELLPAAHGDAIWIEYGAAKVVGRVLIDGGPAHSYETGLRPRIRESGEGSRIDLLVITHIDADHIDGAIILLQELQAANVAVSEFWFNGWPQLPKGDRDVYAPMQGEFLGGLLASQPGLQSVWNRDRGHERVSVPDSGPLPEFQLARGPKLTLLGPTDRELKRLRARWASAIRDFSPGDVKEALRRLKERREYRPPMPPAAFSARQYGDDRSVANGSSISLVLEHEGVRLLLPGDAHARTLASSLERLARQRGEARLKFDAIKLPHHGSMGNVSEAWLKFVECSHWLVSTNGAVFDHPDVETARLIAKWSDKPVFFCNYRCPTTERLALAGASEGWSTEFPTSERGASLRWPAAGVEASPARRVRRKVGAT